MKQLLVLISVLLVFHPPLKAQEDKSPENIAAEISVINSLLNQIYNIGECTRFVTPPYYACCNDEGHMSVEDHVACCLESDIPEQYRIFCQDCINIGELDTLSLIIETIDTLYPLDFVEFRDYILDEMDTASAHYRFIETGFFNQQKAAFDLNLLKQSIGEVVIRNKDDDPDDFIKNEVANKDIRFLRKNEIEEINKKRTLGKTSGNLLAGRIDLSRVYFSEGGNLAFFYFAFLGQNNCGKLNVYLIHREGENWNIDQSIVLDTF